MPLILELDMVQMCQYTKMKFLAEQVRRDR